MKNLIALSLALAGASFSFGHCGTCSADEAKDHKHDAAAKTALSDSCELACADGCSAMVGAYEKVSAALAADDLTAAKEAAGELSCYAECQEDKALGGEVAKVVDAKSIKDAREAFKAVSKQVIAKADGSADYFVMTCPMAKADWIQTTKEVANPYFGSEMLRCGAVKKTVQAKL